MTDMVDDVQRRACLRQANKLWATVQRLCDNLAAAGYSDDSDALCAAYNMRCCAQDCVRALGGDADRYIREDAQMRQEGA